MAQKCKGDARAHIVTNERGLSFAWIIPHAVGQVGWTLKSCIRCLWQNTLLQNPIVYAQSLETINLGTVSVFLCYDCHGYKSELITILCQRNLK